MSIHYLDTPTYNIIDVSKSLSMIGASLDEEIFIFYEPIFSFQSNLIIRAYLANAENLEVLLNFCLKQI